MGSIIDFEALINGAYWVAAIAGALSVIALAGITVMRSAGVRRERAGDRLRATWRELPVVPSGFRSEYLALWNAAQEATYRSPGDRAKLRAQLNGVARDRNLPDLAMRLLRRRDFGDRIVGITALGHLGERAAVPALRDFVEAADPLMSLAAARALLQISSAFAYRFIALMCDRYDWPESRLSTIVREQAAELEAPLSDAVTAADPRIQCRLIPYLRFADRKRALRVVREVLKCALDPEVLAAALKVLGAIGDTADASSAAAFALHETWYVRVQAAAALGQLGDSGQVPVLSQLLQDRQWWVRYRAAQSLAMLVSPEELQAIVNVQSDPFARDVLNQLLAEYVPLLRGVAS